MSQAAGNADFVRRACAAFNARDLEALNQAFDEHASWGPSGVASGLCHPFGSESF